MGNSKNGSKFEQKVEDFLKAKNINFYSQPTLKIGNERVDLILKTTQGILVHLSLKKSLRERYKLTSAESQHLKINCGTSVTYLITEDTPKEISNIQKRINNSPIYSADIQGIVHFDDLDTFIKKFNFIKLNAIEPGIRRYAKRSNI